jgi:hypothetical protein
MQNTTSILAIPTPISENQPVGRIFFCESNKRPKKKLLIAKSNLMIKSRFPNMLLLGCLFITLFSCQKSNDGDEPKTKTALLTASLWKINSVGLDLDKNNTVDLPYPLENCEKDNTLEFKTDGTGISREGATKCDPEDPDSENFNWSLKNNDTILNIAIPGSFFAGDATIITLNETTMEAYLDINDPDTGTQVRIIFKLTH